MTRTQSPKAAIFDLYNTLVPGGSRADRDEVSERMAKLLDVPPGSFAELVRSTFDDRVRGRLGDLRRTTEQLASELGATPTPGQVEAAVALRLELNRSLHRQTWAVPTLTELRRRGIPRGLVTDCSAETPEIWPDSPLSPLLQAVSFSCCTGHRKPEPEAYLHATRALGVAPDDCVFVGDGSSRELSGAAALGMRAVRFIPQGEGIGETIDGDDWSGESVSDLMEVVRHFADDRNP
jgi:putative hydrolase of the HAD superfamily